jgi:hypothetical protein
MSKKRADHDYAKKAPEKHSAKVSAFKNGLTDLEKVWNKMKAEDISEMTQKNKKICAEKLNKVKLEMENMQKVLTNPDPELDTEDDVYAGPWTGKTFLKMTGYKPDCLPSLLDIFSTFTGRHSIGIETARVFSEGEGSDSDKTHIIIEFKTKADAEAAKKIKSLWHQVSIPGGITGFIAKLSDA